MRKILYTLLLLTICLVPSMNFAEEGGGSTNTMRYYCADGLICDKAQLDLSGLSPGTTSITLSAQ